MLSCTTTSAPTAPESFACGRLGSVTLEPCRHDEGLPMFLSKFKHPSLPTYVSVKFVNPELSASDQGADIVQRFRRECGISKLISESGVDSALPCYGSFVQDGCQYLMRKFSPQGDLYSYLSENVRQDGPIEGSEYAVRLKLLEDVLQGITPILSYAHSIGIIHRDIKPENLMFGDANKVVLCDWGSTCLNGLSEPVVGLDQAPSWLSNRITPAEFRAGTPLYMAPEYLSTGFASFYGDIYSLGVTCYEILSGVEPFRRDSEQEVLAAILDGNVAPLHDVSSHVSKELSDAVHNALARRTSSRYSSVEEMRDAISERTHT